MCEIEVGEPSSMELYCASWGSAGPIKGSVSLRQLDKNDNRGANLNLFDLKEAVITSVSSLDRAIDVEHLPNRK